MSAPYQLLPPLGREEREAMRADIEARGVMVPVEVDETGAILDGHHRDAIARELGIEAPRIVRAGMTEAEKRDHVLKLNLLRRQLGPNAWAAAFRALAANRGTALGQGRRNDRTSATVAEVAAELGVTYRTARRRLSLADSLASRPDLAAAVDSGDMPAARARMLAHAEAVAAETRPARLPDGRFDVLYADPPWRFAKEGHNDRDVRRHYPVLDVADIAGYRDSDGRDVPDIVAERAVLFLWVPTALLFEAAPAVLEAWGFEYRHCWMWCKDRVGMGYWARNQHEPLVEAARGGMRAPAESLRQSSVIHAPRGAHSAKPVEVYERIEAAYPDARRVELFARSERPGWATMGNQIAETVA